MKNIILTLVAGWFFLANPALTQVIWQQVTYPFPEAVSTLKVDNNGVLFACVLHDVFYSEDEGINWTQCTNWPGYSPKCISFNSSHHIFIGTYSNGILRSTDGGVTFTAINTGLSFMNVWCTAVLDNDDILAGTPGGLFRSVNNGDSWAPYGTGLPNDELKELSVGNNGKVFAGTNESGVYRSYDQGANWTAVNSGLPDTTLVTALLAVKGTNTVYAGLFPHGLFKSPDDGTTWSENNEGLPFTDFPVAGRGYSIHTIEQFVFFIFLVVYFNAVYYHPFTDLDPQWVPVTTGLPSDPHVTCLATGPGDKMFVGAYDQGLYVNAFPVQVDDRRGNSGMFSVAVTPNPFNRITDLTFSVPTPGHVKVIIYNQYGQAIQCLADKVFGMGEHHLVWDPGKNPPGIFYYNVYTAGGISGGKLVFAP